MPTFDSTKAVLAEFKSFARDIGESGGKKITEAQAERAQKIFARAASADLGGDPKFSGWAPRLDTQIKELRDGHLLTPTRSSAGPWTVAQRGRHQGGHAGFAGPGVNARTGRTSRTKAGAVRKVRTRQGRRWNGTTAGKHTASDALAVINKEMPKIATEGLRTVIRKHFGDG